MPAAVKIVYVPSANTSGAEERKIFQARALTARRARVSTDSKTHLLDDGYSTKFCQGSYVEVLQVGISRKYAGWLEVRAARNPTGFVARGWLNPSVKEAWILGPS